MEDYFWLPPCGVDVQRAYELMTSIDSIGSTAELTNTYGEKVVVTVNENLVKEALHFKEGYKDMKHRLTKSNHDKFFLQIKGKIGMFKDMAVEDAKPPLKLFMQNFDLKKSQKFTRPHT